MKNNRSTHLVGLLIFDIYSSVCVKGYIVWLQQIISFHSVLNCANQSFYRVSVRFGFSLAEKVSELSRSPLRDPGTMARE